MNPEIFSILIIRSFQPFLRPNLSLPKSISGGLWYLKVCSVGLSRDKTKEIHAKGSK